MSGPRFRGEEGVTLLLALAFLALLGMFLGALLTFEYASFKTTEEVRAQGGELYGADGGADVGIQVLQESASYCPEVSSGTQSLPDQTINGRAVHVTCQTLSGSAGGGGEGGLATYALVVTGYPGPGSGSPPDMSEAIKLTGNSHADTVTLRGPVFNAGKFVLGLSTPQMIVTSDLHQYDDAPSTYCTLDQQAAASSGNPQVEGTWSCEFAASLPVPDPLPTLGVPSTAAHAPVVQGSCTILFPGRYTSAPAFNRLQRFYLASGVYYFDNVGQMQLQGEIFGGQPGGGETQQLTNATPCADDATANALVPGSGTGSGVQLVLGRNSKLLVDDHQKDIIELFTRIPANPNDEGTAGVSIYAPRTNGPNWRAWNADKILDMEGNKTTMVIHGMFYAPNARVDKVYALTNPNDAAFFSGGAVVQRINIRFDNQSTNAAASTLSAIALPSPPTPRTVVVTATADPANPGEPPTVVRAVVRLGTSPSTPPTVLSWRKA